MKRILISSIWRAAAMAFCWQAALLLFSVGQCQGQESVMISFDGPPDQPPGTGYLLNQYAEAGMVFTSIGPYGQFIRNGGGYPDPYNGTPYLQTAIGETLAFSPSDSSTVFGLSSVDLAGYSAILPEFDAQFVGYRADGTIVTDEFSGASLGFGTFYFDSSFADLTRVEIPSSLWSLDNLIITTPEPNFLPVTVLAGLAFMARQRFFRARR